MISLYVIIKLLSGVVPEHILEKHVLSMKKVVAMKMNAEESMQAFGLAIAIGCALFSLGGYGANGNFGNNAEKFTAYTIPLFGMSCLFLTAVWKMVAIRGEIKRGGGLGSTSTRQIFFRSHVDGRLLVLVLPWEC